MEKNNTNTTENTTDKNKDEHKPKSGEGVPDGDGGSLEREDSNENTTKSNEKSSVDNGMVEYQQDLVTLEDEQNWGEKPNTDDLSIPENDNSLGNDSDNRRQNEGIEGSLNVKANINSDYHVRADFDREFFFSSSSNRTIGCTASLGPERGYYFKGE